MYCGQEYKNLSRPGPIALFALWYNQAVKKLGIVLNLYQPITQEERKLREISDVSYLPIIKIIKNRKEFRPTLNIPLGLLQQMNFPDLKGFLEEERLELVGSAAYNAALTDLPEILATNQIVLNEYGLGYFFGRRSGFEGESAVLVKDLKGFYPPKFAYDKAVFDLVGDLGYSWILADPNSTSGKFGVFKLGESDCHIVAFNSILTEKILNKTNLVIDDIAAEIQASEDCVLVFDAESFGYKNKDGIYLLNKLLDKLVQLNIEIVPVSEFVEEEIDESRVGKLEMLTESLYKPSEIGLWELNQTFVKVLEKYLSELPKLEVEGMENIAVWEPDLPREVRLTILSAQICDSTQFENMELKASFLSLYSELAELLSDSTLTELVKNQH